MADRTQERIQNALDVARQSVGVDGAHHKAWTIDQMVRALTGCAMAEVGNVDHMAAPTREYEAWVKETTDGEDGSDTYEWDMGVAP